MVVQHVAPSEIQYNLRLGGRACVLIVLIQVRSREAGLDVVPAAGPDHVLAELKVMRLLPGRVGGCAEVVCGIITSADHQRKEGDHVGPVGGECVVETHVADCRLADEVRRENVRVIEIQIAGSPGSGGVESGPPPYEVGYLRL